MGLASGEGHRRDARVRQDRAVLAVCRAAYDRWSVRADSDLTVYPDAAITALAAGFAADKIKAGMPKAD